MRLWSNSLIFLAFLLLALAAACDDGEGASAEGEEQGPCYPNGTCNAGLVCASNICVAPADVTNSDTTADDTGGADTGGNDTQSSDTGGTDTSANDTGVEDTGREDTTTDATDTNTDDTTAADTTTTDTSTADTTTDTAEPDVADQLPTAQINHPSDGETRQLSDGAFPFAGVASDPQDGQLSGASMVWTSSLDGQIGTGESFDAALDTAGIHEITLTATDSDGYAATDTIEITME